MVGVVVIAACAAITLPARSAEGDKVAAKAHFEAATRLYDIHEYAKALEEYKAAYLAKPDPAFLFNVGQCYRRLGKFDQALEFYREYLKKAPADDPNRPNVEARIRNTDNSDVFENDAPSKPSGPPVQPPPSPPQVPPIQQTTTPLVVPPLAQPGPGEAVEKPSSEVGSPASVDEVPQSLRLPAAAEPAAAKPAGLDLTFAESAGQVSPGTPIYKTWWFWTGVGAAVIAGTVTAIVVSKNGSDGNTAKTALGTQPVFQ